jgi:ribosomal-protein-alanine N-acetyltransferase
MNTGFAPFPEFTSKRLNIRRLQSTDAAALFRLRRNEQVNLYTPITPPENIAVVDLLIIQLNDNIDKHKAIFWAIAGRENNELIGSICLWNLDETLNKAEIGFNLLPEYWNTGILSEVMPFILQYGFEQMQLDSIDGWTDLNNIASISLLKKFGFKRNSELESTANYLPGEENMCIYTLTQ